jgi:hypothetical protein
MKHTTGKRTTGSDWAWFIGITIIAVTINPVLKSIGLLPADVFKGLGIFFPGLPQIVFGPLMAFLMLLCFVKTGEALVFPIIGVLRAVSLGFVFPANVEHLGTVLAGILVGFIAWAMVKKAGRVSFATWLPLLAALYSGFYAAGNYLTTLMFGPTAQTQIILGSSHVAIGIVAGSVVIGLLFGVVADGVIRLAIRLLPMSHGLRLQSRPGY